MAKQKEFVASAEAKGKAKQLRLFAILAWIVAIAGEVFAILKLISNETLTWLIVSLVVILALSLVGSFLWKKANRLDPASEKDKVRFFVQNQLGAIMAVLAFLPLVVLIFLNKDLDGKSKGIAGAVGVVALLVAGIAGYDFNPPSIEKYTEEINAQTDFIKNLNGGVDRVYWTSQGNKYHLTDDCQHIRNRDQFEGTVAEAWEARKIGDNELCKTCQRNAESNLDVSIGDFIDEEIEYGEEVLEDSGVE
ncbi:MAG TPA: hypothetical protein VFD65_00995 [Chitinophagales bacterium]|nr:hypothetical protein [Chitinophagales bacterium]